MAKDTFDAIQSGQYKSNGNYRKKKKYETDFDAIQDGSYIYNPEVQKSKKSNVEENNGFFDNWFKAGAFSDGYQFGDVSKTILGSAADVGLGVVEGIMSGGEGIGDWLSYRTADVLDLFGGEDAARSVRENANINATNELFNVIKKKGNIEDNSVFGTKADSISNAMGTILTMTSTAGLGGAAGLGKVGQTALSMGTMGIGSAGSGESEALQSGATPDEARLYGTISGAGEVFSEMLFGGLGKGAKAIGISKGLSSADDMLAKAVSDKFKSRLAKNLTQYGIKAGAEGLEEVISGIIQATGKKLTYMSEEEIGKLLQNEELLDQFIVGAISSGISQTPGLVKTTAKGQDFLTGYTKNEQKVYDTVLNERIEEAQKESKKPLTRKQLNTIEEEVKNDFENGYIGTKKIEDTLGIGEIYNNLKNDTELAFGRELSRDELRDIESETKEKYADLIKDDDLIRRNYYEDSLKSQQFSADINKYDEKLRDTVQRAIDSGILNNSTKTHQFVDLLAKISADKGVTFDFTNNEALKNSSLGIDGATVNGYVNANGDITLNINSSKALDSVVGHEITHVLEGSDLYQALSDSIKEYAQSTGEYEKRLTELNKLYENVEGADVQKELTADLVGDYLFTNQEFVNHLTQNRNLFQKIYDEIKYLVKQVTAGSKEARQLNKAMKMFEKAYKESSKITTEGKTKYSIQGLENYSEQEIKDISNNYIQNILTQNGLDDVEIVDTAIHGSRGRGTAREDSDLDLVVQYKGDIREDDLFNALNDNGEDNLYIDGIRVDINPIQEDLSSYMVRSNQYDEEIKKNTKYSLTQDSEGRELSKEQQNYFKDSKIRDTEGKLKVMYRGDTDLINIFDKNHMAKRYTNFGAEYETDVKGFFFTDNIEYAKNFGNTKEYYINSIKPLELNNNIDELNEIFKPMLDDMLKNEDIYQWQYNKAIEDGTIYRRFIDENGVDWETIDDDAFNESINLMKNLGYDSIKVNEGNDETSIMVFDSNQIKNVDNLNPTTNEDIRYSLSSTGEMVDNNGNKVTLETSDTGTTGTLMAIHNLSEDKLNGVLDLGGFPVPSIAITNPDLIGHNEFGDGTAIFDKSTIDPAVRKNEVYDRDVWSPTFPRVEYEANEKTLDNIRKSLLLDNKNYSNQDSIQRKAVLDLYTDRIENLLDSGDIERVKDEIKNNRDIQYSYLKSKGLIEPVYKPVEFSSTYSNEMLQQFLEQYQGSTDFSWNTPLNELSYEQTMELGKTIQRIVKPYYDAEIEDVKKADVPNEKIRQSMIDTYLDKYNNVPENYGTLSRFIYDAQNLQRRGINAQELDEYATLDKVNDILNKEEYNQWVDDTFNDSIINNKGIRNDKDIFTESGNRRSFKSTHNPVNLENIVKAMTKKDTKGGQDMTIFGTGYGRISAQTSNQFNSINDIKQNENRLMTRETAQEIIEPLSEKLFNDTEELAKYYTKSDYKSDFVAQMQAQDIISQLIEEFAGKDLTVSNLNKLLNEYNFYDTKNIPENVLNDIVDDLKQIKQMPTDYFEAKPQRAVGLDEIEIMAIPNTWSEETKQRMMDNNIKYVEYDPSIEGDRQRVINQFDEYKWSLSQQNEIAPVRQPGLTYGEDIALAPVQEQVSALQEDIAAIREDYRQQSEDIKNELRQLRAEREEMSRGIYENAPSINDIAPTQESSYYENTFAPELSDDLLKKYKSYFKSEFGLKGKQLNEAMEGIKELSTNPNLTSRDVYNYLKENYGKEEIRNYNYDIQEVKSELRNTAIGVDEQTKKDIASMYDTYGKFRKAYLGKLKLVEYDGKNGIDSIYKDLSNKYPQLFNEDTISNTADQLMQLAEVTKMDNYTSMFEDLPEEIVRNDANELYSMIRDYRNETAQRLAEEQVPDSYYDNIVPTEEIPYEEQLENRINELQNDLDLIPRREYYAIQDRTIEDKIREVPVKKDITGLLNDQYQRKADRVEKSKPVIAKQKTDLRRGIDTLKTLFTNRNAEIDNLSRETGNKNIKFAGDMLNNYSAEAQNDIQIAQTDNYGRAIGKSIQEIFKPAKESGLEQAFNDYLINYSNIDRWEAGKGSATPLDISQRLVANYESKYPQFKRWAVDIWKYGKNARNNMLESGLINQDTYNMLDKMYPHYVPYISDSNNFDATIDKMTELKARPIKRARGGATELYPIEEALNRYTFAQKRALRTNNLYKEIVNELLKVKNESPIGADLRTDYTDLKENLYRDDTGNYLTAYDEGVRKSVQISDDLFKALSNDLENRIRDIEQRLSIITKPLQAASNIRRKILTSWSPSFPVKNALKDIQDASLNSTDTTKFMKNYPGAFKELVENKNDLVKQFKALYGAGNTMGVFENESGLYDTKKGLKNSKFLNGISNANEIIELAPRYAEFKTSLENGASIQEAMYNAREITTNFSRGGVITKALNRNGFTFLNASVQGLSKFIRNFSGENGAKGIANSLIKAAVLGIAPALFNELVFGIGDDKDEEYEALPDYIKDNYYIIKTGEGNFVRIPKGRMLSVFGSAARRTIELAEGEEDAFEGYLKNANNQIGINDPEENNIFAPFIQAFGSENGTAWYGGDIVPSRLQNKPVDEQYDASTDKMSIWLGQRLGISPYKLNYVLDQYSGGIGDIVLPMITDEATSEGGLLAPIKDQFTADSTTDNKYVSDFYSKSDELKVKANSSKATDEDILRSQYMSGISSEMAKLYAERRNVQADNSLTKAEKYEKSQEIKKEINKLAKYGLDSNENISVTGNYAQAGDDMGYYKNAKGKWTPIDQKDIVATESIGLTDREKSTYYGVKNDMYNIDQKYESKLKTASDEEKTVLNAQKKVDIINAIKETNLPDEAKAVLYDKKYASTETLDALLNIGIDFDSYLDLEAQNFTADKNIYGKTINGSKKSKVYNYINNLNMDYDKKIMLAKLYYKSDNTYNREIINSLNSNPGISYDEMKQILKAMGMKIDDYGQITW